jgi:alkylation response protein AidB-like acyl-CoA dehydrogenase
MTQDWNALPDNEFRSYLSDFVRSHCNPSLRFPKQKLKLTQVRDWWRSLFEAGLLAPVWPQEFGGMGLNAGKALIYLEAMEGSGAPRLPDQGIINLGPLLIKYGTDWQKDFYLPKILSGQHIWCQGYSEPSAGSDLASLRTSAVPQGNDYVVNGQKIWTSWASDATHIFTLVRTDPTAKKQAGISFLLIELNQPGVKVRPIQTLMGQADFSEIFFDEALTSKDNLVGALNGGWAMAKALLGFERIWAGSPRQARAMLLQLEAFVRSSGKAQDAAVLDTVTKLQFDVADLESTYSRFVGMASRGEPIGADVSILKVWATETCQRISEFLVELCGDLASTQGDVHFDGGVVDPTTPFLDSRSFTIYGGSSEIQRNILARNVLNLPT